MFKKNIALHTIPLLGVILGVLKFDTIHGSGDFSSNTSHSVTQVVTKAESEGDKTPARNIFSTSMAKSYDKKGIDAESKEALFAGATKILKGLPNKSKVLCVGAGTGAEIINFAEAFPEWTFTAVDPSAEMMKTAREKIEILGISSRVRLHVGTLETLEDDGGMFDLATSILVSHYLGGEEQRREFFGKIAERLNPGGHLITADLVNVAGSEGVFLPSWYKVIQEHSFPYKDTETIKRLIASAGFNEPIQFHQWLYIHGFVTRKTVAANETNSKV